jgi:cytochrome b561
MRPHLRRRDHARHQQETFMSHATPARRKLDDPPTRDAVAGDAAVIEFVKLPGGTPLKHAVPAYTATARILHWITALVIALMIPLGVIIANDWGGPLRDRLYGLHESLGTLLIPLILARLVHRLTNPPLPLPPDIPPLQRLAAHATHLGLYALLVAQPLVGWIATSAYGAPVTVLGLFALPPIAPENHAFAELLFRLHGLIGLAIAGLVAAHVGAALYHHVVRKDRVLMRMISG